MPDELDDVLADAEDVFGFRERETHQERAHRYIDRNGEQRQPGDTAPLCAVRHMVARASRGQGAAPSEAARAARSEGAAALLRLAVELGG